MFQALEVDRTGNTFGAEHPVIQTIDQFEVSAMIKLLLQLLSSNCAHRLDIYSTCYAPVAQRATFNEWRREIWV